MRPPGRCDEGDDGLSVKGKTEGNIGAMFQ